MDSPLDHPPYHFGQGMDGNFKVSKSITQFYALYGYIHKSRPVININLYICTVGR